MPSPKGAVPWQLKTARRRNRHARGYVPNPLAEATPSLTANEIANIIPRKQGIVRKQIFQSANHHAIALELTCEMAKVAHPTGRIQTLRIKTIRTGFGGLQRPRFHFVCEQCGRGCLKL